MYSTGLSRHKKMCTQILAGKNKNEDIDVHKIINLLENKKLKQLILKQQQNIINQKIEVNNTFNLQLFLDERCKMLLRWTTLLVH